jgi:Protein of unknown function (DUF2786)
MTQIDKDRLIEKVRKLLALSTSSNEHEAALAAEKAQAILAEYNLSMSDVRVQSTNEDNFVVNKDIRTDSVPWRRRLGAAIAEMYFCKYFYYFEKEYIPSRPKGYVRYDRHNFVGASHNIAVVQMMFQYLIDTIERLANEGSLRFPMNERSQYRTSFKAACSLRVMIRIHKRIQEAKAGQIKSETGTTLPALASLYDQTSRALTTFIQENVGQMKASKSRITQSHTAGAQDGYDAGNKVGLDPQVRGKSSGHLLGRS